MCFTNDSVLQETAFARLVFSNGYSQKLEENFEAHSTSIIVIVEIEYATKERAVPWGPIWLANTVLFVFDSRAE
jgi:hypothetical protein